MKVGLAITTFQPGTPERLGVTKRSIESLVASNPAIDHILLVDDGSKMDEHLSGYPSSIEIVKRKIRGGVTCAKNTCIKKLMEYGCDIIALADDDLIYRPEWEEQYINAMQILDLDYMAWYGEKTSQYLALYDPAPPSPAVIKGLNVRICYASRGILIWKTRKLIETLGYLRSMPDPIGYEHSEYANRYLKSPLMKYEGIIDIQNPEKWLYLDDISSKTSTCYIDSKNREIWNTYPVEYVPCIEYRNDYSDVQ